MQRSREGLDLGFVGMMGDNIREVQLPVTLSSSPELVSCLVPHGITKSKSLLILDPLLELTRKSRLETVRKCMKVYIFKTNIFHLKTTFLDGNIFQA